MNTSAYNGAFLFTFWHPQVCASTALKVKSLQFYKFIMHQIFCMHSQVSLLQIHVHNITYYFLRAKISPLFLYINVLAIVAI